MVSLEEIEATSEEILKEVCDTIDEHTESIDAITGYCGMIAILMLLSPVYILQVIGWGLLCITIAHYIHISGKW